MNNRELIADLVQALHDSGQIKHLDVLGGVYFALDLDEALDKLQNDGWEFTKAETPDG